MAFARGTEASMFSRRVARGLIVGCRANKLPVAAQQRRFQVKFPDAAVKNAAAV